MVDDDLERRAAEPVEVRDAAKLVLRARGLSDDKLEVPAGRYFVTAVLPNGEQMTLPLTAALRRNLPQRSASEDGGTPG